jgi:23S rRNA pseudouridine1911/1915/1917 synthase
VSEPETRLLLVASDAAADRLDRVLARAFSDLSRSRLQGLVRDGRVKVAGAVVRESSTRVQPGAEIVLEIPAAAPAEPRGEPIALSVVYEDEEIIVIDKPAGLVVHPAAGHDSGTLVNALIAHCGESLSGIGGVKRPGIVHRLDKDTSGLLVVAKTVEAQASLVKQLADHSMRRVYLAVVQGDPPASGVIDAPVGRDARARTRMAVTHRGKPSRTNYRVLERYGHAALVECRLETGRTHQIRVHFQHLRHPLVGDETYRRGTRHGIAFPRQALHAIELSLLHPTSGKTVSWSAPLPRDMKRLIEGLRK